MIKHIVKLIWNKKAQNGLMLLEIFLSFLVVFFIFTYTLSNYKKYSEGRGFEPKDKWIVMLDMDASLDSLASIKTKKNLKQALLNLDKIETVAASSWCTPYGGSISTTSNDDMGFDLRVRLGSFGYDFADAMDLNMVEGRWFNEEDLSATYEPIVLSKSTIEEYFDGKSMVDSIIQFNGDYKIVGIAENYKYLGDFDDTHNFKFNLEHPYSEDVVAFILKMQPGTPLAYQEKVINVVNSNLGNTGSIIQNLEQRRQRSNLDTWVPLTVLLSICIFLAINVALGLFGILWYNINKRKGEIGLRRALGAHGSDIIKQFIAEILILTIFAILLGVFFAIQFPLLKVGPFPPGIMYQSILYATLFILFIVSLCAFFPSIQASKIHPATALHED